MQAFKPSVRASSLRYLILTTAASTIPKAARGRDYACVAVSLETHLEFLMCNVLESERGGGRHKSLSSHVNFAPGRSLMVARSLVGQYSMIYYEVLGIKVGLGCTEDYVDIFWPWKLAWNWIREHLMSLETFRHPLVKTSHAP